MGGSSRRTVESVEQNGDEHVAHEVDAGAHAGDDPFYGQKKRQGEDGGGSADADGEGEEYVEEVVSYYMKRTKSA